MDQYILDQLSDHAAVHQMLLAVRLSRPQNRAGKSSEMAKTEDRRAWRHGKYDVLDAECIGGSFMARGVLLKRFYDLDSSKAKSSSAWVDQDIAVHGALNTYWAAVRQNRAEYMTDPDIANFLEADVSPKHVAALQKERQTIASRLSEQAAIPSGPLAPLHAVTNLAEPVTASTKTKTKKKTRPALSEVEVNQAAQAPLDSILRLDDEKAAQQLASPTVEVPIVSASKRTVDLFNKVYPEDANAFA